MKHESDANINATTVTFYYKVNDYVQLVQNAIIHDELNGLILTFHALNFMMIDRE